MDKTPEQRADEFLAKAARAGYSSRPDKKAAGGASGRPDKTPAGTAFEAEVERLASLPDFQCEQQLKGSAEKHNVSVSFLRKKVKDKCAKHNPDADNGKQGHVISFPEPKPWPEEVDGAVLLDEIATAIRRHVVMSDHDRDMCALWTMHSYPINCFSISPRLAIRSPTKRCGKTTLLDVLARLVARPLPTANITSAALFRVVEDYGPTLLIDEADTFLNENNELRGILNSGHRKGGSVLRTVGDDYEPRAFSTYSPCAIAKIGKLPDTLHDRSNMIDLKRRLPSEKVEPFRPDRAERLDLLARKIVRWAKDHAAAIADADPDMPPGIINREADNWRPLLAIADEVGGDWPRRAGDAAIKSHAAADDDAASGVERLLADIRDIFKAKESRQEVNADRISSASLVSTLVAIEDSPWGEYDRSGKPLTQSKLGRLLNQPGLHIKPHVIRIGKETPRGYLLSDFEDAFARLLPPEGGFEVQQCNKCDETGTSDTFQSATSETDVALRKCEKPNNDGLCCAVALSKGGSGQANAAPDSPTDDGLDMPTTLRRCDHCGRPGAERWDWHDGRAVYLHAACEHAWADQQDGGRH